MSSLLTGETASNNYNVAKVFAGESTNKEASAQRQTDYKPPSVIMPPMIPKIRQVPNMVKMLEWRDFKMVWVDRQIGTKPEFYWE